MRGEHYCLVIFANNLIQGAEISCGFTSVDRSLAGLANGFNIAANSLHGVAGGQSHNCRACCDEDGEAVHI